MHLRLLAGIAVVALLLPVQSSAQQPYSVRWPTAVLVADPDTSVGILLSVFTPAAVDDAAGIIARIHPDSARNWIEDARFVIGAQKPSEDDDFRKYASPVLHAAAGDLLFVGQDPKPPQYFPRFYLVLADSTRKQPLRFYTERQGMERFLAILDSASHVARYDSAAVVEFVAARRRRLDPNNQPPHVLHQPRMEEPKGLSGPADVYADVVVTAQGAPDTSRIRILYSDHPKLTEAVRRVIVGSTFEPARRNGQAVEGRFSQRYRFRSSIYFRQQ